ncbi:MAG: hypothetical protein ABSH12_09490, partial [Endomicrobiales bacterium]
SIARQNITAYVNISLNNPVNNPAVVTQGPEISFTPIGQLLSNVVVATGTVTDGATLQTVTMTYYTDTVPTPVTVTNNPGNVSAPAPTLKTGTIHPGVASLSTQTTSTNTVGGVSTYNFTFTITPDLSSASSFYYILQAVDSKGKSARLPATGYFLSGVAHTIKSTINTSGGTIALPDGNQFGGRTAIIFPPGALGSNQEITISEVLPQDVGIFPPTGKYVLGVDIPVVTYQFLPESLTFSRPVMITLMYPDINNTGIVDGTKMPAKNLVVLWWNPTYQQWDSLGGTVDTISKTIACQITHFGIFGVGFNKAANTDSSHRPEEKIITPVTAAATYGIAHFKDIGLNDEINIYDITGRTIRTFQQMQGIVEWDGKDQDGRIVASGIYIYQIKINGQNKPISGTIVVAK